MSLSPIKLAAMAIFATAVLAACEPSSDPSGDVGAGPVQGDAERIVIDDRLFEPNTLELTPGKEVTIEIVNNDGGPHDFAIDAIDLNTGTIESGETASARFTVPEGTTEFRCTYHDGMDGRIEPR
jgi:plastocyanin